MAWVAFDCAVKSIEQFGLPGPADRWRAVRQQIHDEVCARGFDRELGAFVQSYGSPRPGREPADDPAGGVPAGDDPRVVGTVAAIERELMRDGFVPVTGRESDVDGLPAGEGAFLPCTFWLVDNYALQGRTAEAHALFDRLIGLCNDVGLLSEEYDPGAGRMLGNFPQAFTHVALVNSALDLARSEKPAEQRGGATDVVAPR